MDIRKYIASERFIHDNLVKLAEAGLQGIYKEWRKSKKIDSFFVTWPAEPVFADNGAAIEDLCIVELPSDKSKWRETMVSAMQRTRAYGILLVEQRENDVKALFETKHGARCWTIPIIRSGDVLTLKKPDVTTDREHIGLLWRQQPSVS